MEASREGRKAQKAGASECQDLGSSVVRRLESRCAVACGVVPPGAGLPAAPSTKQLLLPSSPTTQLPQKPTVPTDAFLPLPFPSATLRTLAHTPQVGARIAVAQSSEQPLKLLTALFFVSNLSPFKLTVRN